MSSAVLIIWFGIKNMPSAKCKYLRCAEVDFVVWTELYYELMFVIPETFLAYP